MVYRKAQGIRLQGSGQGTLENQTELKGNVYALSGSETLNPKT